MAVHWQNAPDGSAGTTTVTTVLFLAAAILTLAGAALELLAARRGYGVFKPVVGFQAGFATRPPAILVSTMWANLDAPTWQTARITVLVGIFPVVASVVAGVTAWLISPTLPVTRPRQEPTGDTPSVGLIPGERASWVGGTTNWWLVWAFLPVSVLVAAGSRLAANDIPLSVLLGVALVLLLSSLLVGRLRVRADSGASPSSWGSSAGRAATSCSRTSTGQTSKTCHCSVPAVSVYGSTRSPAPSRTRPAAVPRSRSPC
jgi:hypothetical protein